MFVKLANHSRISYLSETRTAVPRDIDIDPFFVTHKLCPVAGLRPSAGGGWGGGGVTRILGRQTLRAVGLSRWAEGSCGLIY